MFDETLVVQSAVSAFNNAALVAPTFFWTGLLAAPLMVLAYFYGADFLRRMGWRDDNVVTNSCTLTVALTLVWLIMFGGNYGVLRDAASVLPYCIAGVVFVCSGLIGAVSRSVPMPRLRDMSWRWRGIWMICLAFVAFAVGMSGNHTWWGTVMQIGAFAGGALIGRLFGRASWTVPGCLAVVCAVSTLMLMQPEFFRFGQLGALSAVHLGALVITGGAVAAFAALCWARPAGRIHHSAYVKLKWMMRFVTALAVVLFMLTESVPVFLGALGMMFFMFLMSIWHSKNITCGIAPRMLAVALGLFGLITTMPVISALGVIIWAAAPKDAHLRDAGFLL